MIHDAVELMSLLISGVELVYRPKISVLLDGQLPRMGEIAGDPRCWCEVQILQAVVRGIENWVEDDVYRLQVPTNDRANLRGDARRVPMLGVVAELEIHAVENRAFIGLRDGEQHAYLDAVEHCAGMTGSFADTVQRQIQSRLEPRCYTVCPLGHAVERLVGQDAAGKCRGGQGLGNEIVVQRQIERAPRCQSAVVHLDLVGLSGDHSRHGDCREGQQGEYPHGRAWSAHGSAQSKGAVSRAARTACGANGSGGTGELSFAKCVVAALSRARSSGG